MSAKLAYVDNAGLFTAITPGFIQHCNLFDSNNERVFSISYAEMQNALAVIIIQ